MTFERSEIIMLIGMCIFVPAFAFQVLKLYRGGKNTYGISSWSWTLNFIGRYLWIIFGFLMGSIITDGEQKSLFSGNLILVGQGLVTLLSISMIYYSFRNSKSNGEYKKELFAKKLLAFRMFLALITVSSILLMGLGLNHVLEIPTSKTAALVVSLTATFFTGIAFLPQGIKAIKTKNTKSTSVYLSVLFAIGNSLLIIALLVKIIDHPDLLIANIGGIVLPVVSTSMMFVISIIKIRNMIIHKEK